MNDEKYEVPAPNGNPAGSEQGSDPAPRQPPKRPLSAQAEKNARFRAFVRQAPESPGVYIMRDAEGTIIYVGKAKILRNRLLSYFSGKKDIKTRHLVSRVAAIEWVLAGSEYDALIIENNFIKEHNPKYNISLKDGKTYPSIRITKEEYPRIFRTRRIISDGSEYFGPLPFSRDHRHLPRTHKAAFPPDGAAPSCASGKRHACITTSDAAQAPARARSPMKPIWNASDRYESFCPERPPISWPN